MTTDDKIMLEEYILSIVRKKIRRIMGKEPICRSGIDRMLDFGYKSIYWSSTVSCSPKNCKAILNAELRFDGLSVSCNLLIGMPSKALPDVIDSFQSKWTLGNIKFDASDPKSHNDFDAFLDKSLKKVGKQLRWYYCCLPTKPVKKV